MASININAGSLDCFDPSSPWYPVINMGTTYRGGSFNYYLNYDWNWATYQAVGQTPQVLLRYILDGGTSQSYGTLPLDATNFQITLPAHDTVILQFEFQVGGGGLCYQNINVPSSQIQTLP